MADTSPPPSGWEPEPSAGYGAYPPPPPPNTGTPPYAPWWRRLLAGLLDWFLVAVPVGILASVFGLVEVARDVEGDLVLVSGSSSLSLLVFLAALVYSGLMDGSQQGATVGKLALQIQVRDATVGGPIGFVRALGRRFIFLILFRLLVIPGLLNALSPLWDARRQAWHDKAVKSVVVNSA